MKEKNYSVGESYSVYIGDPIIRLRTRYKTAVRQVAIPDRSLELDDVAGKVHAGEKYEVYGTTILNGEKVFVVPIDPDRPWQQAGIFVTSNGDVLPTCGFSAFDVMPETWVLVEDCISTSAQLTVSLRSDPKYAGPVGGEDNFELVYTGISENELKILYREYTGEDLARPAFYQTLTYSKDAHFIRFRDIKMEVLKATNEQITVRVVQN